MKIAVGADHKGFDKKQQLIQSMHDLSILWVDVGCESTQQCERSCMD